jgi:hypothetical protein
MVSAHAQYVWEILPWVTCSFHFLAIESTASMQAVYEHGCNARTLALFARSWCDTKHGELFVHIYVQASSRFLPFSYTNESPLKTQHRKSFNNFLLFIFLSYSMIHFYCEKKKRKFAFAFAFDEDDIYTNISAT